MSTNNQFEALLTSSSDNSDEEEEVENDCDSSTNGIVVPSGEHRLQYTYFYWYSKKGVKTFNSCHESFENCLRYLGKMSSAEQFWNLYTHIIRPGELKPPADLHIFKEGIKPMWEDEANRFGGRWILRLRKGLVSRSWENLVLAMLGEQFMVGDEICGAVVTIRYNEDFISIWNRSAEDVAVINRIRDTFRRVLNLPAETIIEYRAHTDSIKNDPLPSLTNEVPTR